ncbi:MAG: DNA recombination protein RmuC [Thermaurantimonas sp.]
MNTQVILLISILVVLFFVLLLFFKKSGEKELLSQIERRLTILETQLTNVDKSVKENFTIQRQELNAALGENRRELSESIRDFKNELNTAIKNIHELSAKSLETIHQTLFENFKSLHQITDDAHRENRNEIKETLTTFGSEQKSKLDELNTTLRLQLDKIENKVESKLQALSEQAKNDSNQMRESVGKSLKDFEDRFEKNVNNLSEAQIQKLALLEKSQTKLVEETEKKLENIRTTVEEKLEKTLSERLGQSFETVSKQLNEVQRGLGEMQAIASEVGGLKKVLSNVKLRGGVGEIQLAILLEQMLAPSQYQANVITRPGGRDAVEFAIKLPGRSDDEAETVYLPIDAKFPKDVYENLLSAYDIGHPEEISKAISNLESVIKKMAKDISDKYINPPLTTDFAIMFLPFEGIYAEVIRRSALVDQLRTEYHVTIAGPTTLSAFINSLQMGFRTLALQKRSSEVWRVLGAVKTEFEKFGGLLEKAKNNIQTGLNQLDQVAGTRTRAIQRHLRSVQALPVAESRKILPDVHPDNADQEAEDQSV